jgi:hypothetical protein
VYQAHLVAMAVLECVQLLLDNVFFMLVVAVEMCTARARQDWVAVEAVVTHPIPH